MCRGKRHVVAWWAGQAGGHRAQHAQPQCTAAAHLIAQLRSWVDVHRPRDVARQVAVVAASVKDARLLRARGAERATVRQLRRALLGCVQPMCTCHTASHLPQGCAAAMPRWWWHPHARVPPWCGRAGPRPRGHAAGALQLLASLWHQHCGHSEWLPSRTRAPTRACPCGGACRCKCAGHGAGRAALDALVCVVDGAGARCGDTRHRGWGWWGVGGVRLPAHQLHARWLQWGRCKDVPCTRAHAHHQPGSPGAAAARAPLRLQLRCSCSPCSGGQWQWGRRSHQRRARRGTRG